jgi:hypothetical protein
VQALARTFPQQTEKHLAAASRIIGSVPLAGFGWSEAQKLGFSAQNQYGELVQTLLDAATMDVIRKAPVQLSRLLHILELCAQDFDPPASVVGQWLKKDRPRQFQAHKHELDQLREALKLQMLDLEAPMDKVIGVRSRLGALFDELMAQSIACEWLCTVEQIDEAARTVLLERSQALLKTAGLVKAQQTQSMAVANQLDALRDRIQDAVLLALPSWMAHLAGLPAFLNDSQRFIVRDDLRQIIQRLKN